MIFLNDIIMPGKADIYFFSSDVYNNVCYNLMQMLPCPIPMISTTLSFSRSEQRGE